jgi:ribosomal subunit interface protein
MAMNLQLTFHGLPASEALSDLVRERAARLERLSHRLIACRVLIDSPNHRRQHGPRFRVRVDLTLPGHELVVDREPDEDAYAAVSHAFDSVRRQLLDVTGKQHDHAER